MTADRPLRLAFLAAPNEGLAREWMAWLADRGHRVDLIARHDSEIADGLHPDVTVTRMRAYRGVVMGRLSALDARRAIRDVLGRLDPDILHVHDLTTGFGWLARVSGHHPYVLTVWGSDLYRVAPASRPARILTRLALRRADLVTANSDHLAATAVRAGAREGRVRVVNFGIDPADYAPSDPDPILKRSLGLEGRRIVFAPRQIAPLYDQAAIVRALPMLPADVSVVMSARAAIATTLQALLALADDLGVRDRLVLVPAIPHDEMPRYLGIADVVVSVPHTDAAAATVLEAMAAGRPVVATDLPSPREFLAETWPDLLVPLGDPAAIAKAVGWVFGAEPATLRRRTADARRVVLERADRGEQMHQMEDAYRALVRSDGRGSKR